MNEDDSTMAPQPPLTAQPVDDDETDPSLLREWSYSNNLSGNNQSNTSETPNTTATSPAASINAPDESATASGASDDVVVPVAPAVVVLPPKDETTSVAETNVGLIDHSNEPSAQPNSDIPTSTTPTDTDAPPLPSSQYTYPVATFVSNLVRSGIGTIADHMATAYAEVEESSPSNNTPSAGQTNDANFPTSTRSEAVHELRRLVNVAPSAASLRRTESEADIPTLDESEFVIVDGELVEIPAQHFDDEEEEYEDYEDSHLHQNQNRKFGRRKSRGRFRRLRKWIKKRASRRQEDNTIPEDVPPPTRGGYYRNRRRRSSSARITHSSDDASAEDDALLLQQMQFSLQQLQPPNTFLPPPAAAAIPPAATAAPATIVAALPATQHTRTASDSSAVISADYLGDMDQLLAAGALTDVAEVFIESDSYKSEAYGGKYDGSKGTKNEDYVLDSMLQIARHETEDVPEDALMEAEDAEHQDYNSLSKPQAKVDSDSKPLSEATTLDKEAWNDTLKVVLLGSTQYKSAVGRAMAGKKLKRPKHSLGVNVHTWTPDWKFSIWDVTYANAGTHYATQSLFFSGATLYVLLWDLAYSNQKTYRNRAVMMDEEDDDDEETEFMVEAHVKSAERALELDIEDRVLSWVEAGYSGSAILPVVTVSEEMDPKEIQRRCSMLQVKLMVHPIFDGQDAPRLILGTNDSILRICLESGMGVPELQETIHAIGKEKVFPHVGTVVHPHIVEVNQTIRRLKEDHKVILLDHLMGEVKSRMTVEEVQGALYYLSNIGEVLYYGNSTDELLSRYVILSRKWLVSALSCILRPDLKRELDETRRFMNLQCVYSGEAFHESDIVHTLLQGTNSSCPLLSARDSAMLWQSMSFMRDAADRTAQLAEASDNMYNFLERLLVHTGVFLPLTLSSEPTYFVPSLLDTAASPGIWTYKSSESWMTTLCHSWLLRDGAPVSIMEHVTVCLLQDLYEFSHTFQGKPVRPLHNPKTYPMGTGSMNEFMEAHNNEAIGRIKIHQVMCWKTCLLVKIGTVFADAGHGELRESFSEIFVALVDDQSDYCVATRDMSNIMKRLIVCGKGQVGHHGRKLWKGGYALVLDSIKASLADADGCNREVVCPECLAHYQPRDACTWIWDQVRAANETGNAGVRCGKGHLVDTNLLCGLCNVAPKAPPAPHGTPTRSIKPVSMLLNSVVVVGLWDCDAEAIRSVGSGFIYDKKLGLVVTAGHTLFDMAPGHKFGSPYFGIRNAKVVIGVIAGDGHKAVFRYFAEIVSYDIENVDACVLRITTKLEKDVDGQSCGGQPEIPISNFKNEKLTQLKTTRTFELEQSVRILGFNQGGEGVLEVGKHVNRVADFAKGYICKMFTNLGSDDSSVSSRESASSAMRGSAASLKSPAPITASFTPREEIVVMCPTISGHSGGPCVNDEGRVVGILSRADPVDRQRCYLVPVNEIKKLVGQARVSLS